MWHEKFSIFTERYCFAPISFDVVLFLFCFLPRWTRLEIGLRYLLRFLAQNKMFIPIYRQVFADYLKGAAGKQYNTAMALLRNMGADEVHAHINQTRDSGPKATSTLSWAETSALADLVLALVVQQFFTDLAAAVLDEACHRHYMHR